VLSRRRLLKSRANVSATFSEAQPKHLTNVTARPRIHRTVERYGIWVHRAPVQLNLTGSPSAAAVTTSKFLRSDICSLNFGPLRYVLVSLEFHHWHHSSER
jgi:hypothetical protein